MSYRAIDGVHVIATLERLEQRIEARFPDAGLRAVCREVTGVARDADEKARAFGQPDRTMQALTWLVVLAVFGFGVWLTAQARPAMGLSSVADGVQVLDAIANLVVVGGAAALSLLAVEGNRRRNRALAALHELRSIMHVIDMHQLTKDPGVLDGPATAVSPKRTMSPYELTRYLDYCSELLSLTGKIAALYAQHLNERAVTEAASGLEQLGTSLSQEIGQKLIILNARAMAVGTASKA